MDATKDESKSVFGTQYQNTAAQQHKHQHTSRSTHARSSSPGAQRPPGKATCPDHRSRGLTARRMKSTWKEAEEGRRVGTLFGWPHYQARIGADLCLWLRVGQGCIPVAKGRQRIRPAWGRAGLGLAGGGGGGCCCCLRREPEHYGDTGPAGRVEGCMGREAASTSIQGDGEETVQQHGTWACGAGWLVVGSESNEFFFSIMYSFNRQWLLFASSLLRTVCTNVCFTSMRNARWGRSRQNVLVLLSRLPLCVRRSCSSASPASSLGRRLRVPYEVLNAKDNVK